MTDVKETLTRAIQNLIWFHQRPDCEITVNDKRGQPWHIRVDNETEVYSFTLDEVSDKVIWTLDARLAGHHLKRTGLLDILDDTRLAAVIDSLFEEVAAIKPKAKQEVAA